MPVRKPAPDVEFEAADREPSEDSGGIDPVIARVARLMDDLSLIGMVVVFRSLWASLIP